jgi:hypothetical protein
VLAAVREGDRIFDVEKRSGEKSWTCSCAAGAAGCKHARATQLLVFECDVSSTKSRDAAALAASGAVTIRLEAQQSGLADVVHGGKTFTVARAGFGGGQCSCGALNADCLHGDAARFATRRP